jgi:hypothetical protein
MRSSQHSSSLDNARRGAPVDCIYCGQGRPVSRILLYPAIHLREIPGLPLREAAPTSPGREPPLQTIWLARTGSLPGRSLQLSPRDAAGGLLPHPFTHHL